MSACQAIRTGLLPTPCIVRSRPPAGRAAPPGGAGGGGIAGWSGARRAARPARYPRWLIWGRAGRLPHTSGTPCVPRSKRHRRTSTPRHYGERERAPWVCVTHGATAPGEPPGSSDDPGRRSARTGRRANRRLSRQRPPPPGPSEVTGRARMTSRRPQGGKEGTARRPPGSNVRPATQPRGGMRGVAGRPVSGKRRRTRMRYTCGPPRMPPRASRAVAAYLRKTFRRQRGHVSREGRS